jgi:hypothetical protein
MAQWIRAIRSVVRFPSLAFGLLAAGLTCAVAVACYVASEQRASFETDEDSPQWASISRVDLTNLATAGKNAYFNLEPGCRLRYADGSLARTFTVRRKTKMVDGVETRVIEEKEEKDGQPTKIVWKYYAIDKTTTALYCFGIHVQDYQNGKLVGHRGWRSGVYGAVFTLVMPAAPKLGDTLVHGHGRRVYEVIDTAAKIVTPAGTFTNCLRIRTKESGGQDAREKAYAPGVGLVQDGQFSLVKISQVAAGN